MKALFVNGSPRKNWNTHKMLESAMEGASEAGAETELVHLYDLNFKGCLGCMACKLKGGKSLGRCVVNDGLKPVLNYAHEADIVVIGSPIYWHEVTGETRCFLERLLFQYNSYDDYDKPLSTPKQTAMIYTMNMPEKLHPRFGYDEMFRKYEDLLTHFFGHCATLYSAETMQVSDYSCYHLGVFNEEKRKLRHEQVFPKELQNAFELGNRLVEKVKAQ